MKFHRSAACAAWTALVLFAPALMAESPAPPVIVVGALYPGANATVVADTVAAPIEQQLHGLDGVIRLVSRSGDDGTYALSVIFRPGVDLDQAKIAVQNRLALAQPTLPESVRRLSVTLAVKQPIRAVVCLTSPMSRHDVAMMSGMANQLKNDLARIPGVGAITDLGAAEQRLRIWLDPDRLSARSLSALDVVKLLEKQAPADGRNTEDALQMLKAVNVLEQIVLKTDDGGNVIRLNDVARVELGVQARDHATFNGQSCVALFITAADDSKELMKRIADRAAQLGAKSPEGLTIVAPWDLSSGPASGEFALIDISLPDSTSAERARETASQCERLLRQVDGVADVLSLTANPFDLDHQQPCLLVRLTANSEALRNRQLIRQVRARLGQESDIAARLRDQWSPSGLAEFAYPIDFAISGPDIGEARELAEKLVEKLRQSTKLTDVAVNRDSRRYTRLDVVIDRKKAAALGLKPQEIADTVELYMGSLAVGGSDRTGPRWYVGVPSDGQFRTTADVLKQVRLRNAQGQMVPLGTVVDLRSIATPAAIYRLDTKPMVRVTGNLTDGEAPEGMRAFCEKFLDQLLKEPGRPAGYRLTWLREADRK